VTPVILNVTPVILNVTSVILNVTSVILNLIQDLNIPRKKPTRHHSSGILYQVNHALSSRTAKSAFATKAIVASTSGL